MLPLDKLLHLLGGAVIAALVMLVANPVAAIVAVLLVGAAKEWIYDAWLGKGNFEPMDLLATVAGGGLMVLAYAVQMYFPV